MSEAEREVGKAEPGQRIAATSVQQEGSAAQAASPLQPAAEARPAIAGRDPAEDGCIPLAAVPAGPHAAEPPTSCEGRHDGDGGDAAGADATQHGAGSCGEGKQRREAQQVSYRQYRGEQDLQHVMRLIDTELSEPYSVFTYRYFLHQWPSLCVFACNAGGSPIATIVAKVEPHKSSGAMRGYIAMLVVQKPFRGAGIGTQLVKRAIEGMKRQGASEVVLEAETHNAGALAMYEGLGFIRDKRLERYYLSGTDAFRLKLLLPPLPDAAALATKAEAELEARRLEAAEAEDASLKLTALRVESLAQESAV